MASDVIGEWHKGGLRIGALGAGLRYSHAMLPTPYLADDVLRVYFSACDINLRGRIFVAELSSVPPYDLISISERPVLDLGHDGDFDCDGVNPSQIIRVGDVLYLLYIGWKRFDRNTPYTLIAGYASSVDGGSTFTKRGMLLPPSGGESLFRTAPFVFREGAQWRMLYIGGDQFIDGPGDKRLPVYDLKTIVSDELFRWPEAGEEILSPDRGKGEIGFGRPVLRTDDSGASTLVLSRRTVDGYRLIEAAWPLGDTADLHFTGIINPGPEAWDSEMTCFASFCRIRDHELMFYNGNRFGRSGCGIAWRNIEP